MRILLCALLALPLCGQEAAGPETVAWRAPTILPISGAPIRDGVLIVSRGKIVACGPYASTPRPEGCEVRPLEGVLMPGLVDTHSHIGGGSGGDGSSPLQPECAIWETLNGRDPGFLKARSGGITTVNILPGSGHLLSGQTIYLKLRDSQNVADFLLKDADGWVMGGLKMANGTNPLREGGGAFPGTRARSAAMVRQLYLEASRYRAKLQKARDEGGAAPERDLRLEPLVEVLEGKRIVHHHTHRHDDILTVLRIAEEFGYRIVLHHVSEGWRVPEEIAAAKAPCSLIVIDSPGGKLEAVDLLPDTGRILHEAGVLVSFHTDDGITDSRLFLRSAALAVRAGMNRDEALRALTINAARQLDLQDRVGTLEAGKDADFILLSGDPFSTYTKVLGTWVEGTRVFDRSLPAHLLAATGGLGASDGQSMHVLCGFAGHIHEHDDDEGDHR